MSEDEPVVDSDLTFNKIDSPATTNNYDTTNTDDKKLYSSDLSIHTMNSITSSINYFSSPKSSALNYFTSLKSKLNNDNNNITTNTSNTTTNTTANIIPNPSLSNHTPNIHNSIELPLTNRRESRDKLDLSYLSNNNGNRRDSRRDSKIYDNNINLSHLSTLSGNRRDSRRESINDNININTINLSHLSTLSGNRRDSRRESKVYDFNIKKELSIENKNLVPIKRELSIENKNLSNRDIKFNIQTLNNINLPTINDHLSTDIKLNDSDGKPPEFSLPFHPSNYLIPPNNAWHFVRAIKYGSFYNDLIDYFTQSPLSMFALPFFSSNHPISVFIRIYIQLSVFPFFWLASRIIVGIYDCIPSCPEPAYESDLHLVQHGYSACMLGLFFTICTHLLITVGWRTWRKMIVHKNFHYKKHSYFAPCLSPDIVFSCYVYGLDRKVNFTKDGLWIFIVSLIPMGLLYYLIYGKSSLYDNSTVLNVTLISICFGQLMQLIYIFMEFSIKYIIEFRYSNSEKTLDIEKKYILEIDDDEEDVYSQVEPIIF